MSKKTTYDPVRGVRIPTSIWQAVVREARAAHQRPSDFIRAAITQRLTALKAKNT